MNKSTSGQHLLSTKNSTGDYYKSLNKTYHHLFGKHLMLHYPFYKKDNESLEERQVNLTDFCMHHAPALENKILLEVGCGNGIQTLYIAENYPKANIIGIDLNPDNIQLALHNMNGIPNVDFRIDNAQNLDTIGDESIDLLICIESAFHYPDKEQFLQQIKRVLKPSGSFIIADIINKNHNRTYITKRWKSKMHFHHWTQQQYIDSFSKNGLKINYKENITSSVLKGYQGSKNWISRKNCGSLLSYIGYRIFVIIQVGINVRLLKKKEDYIIFIGQKA
jgi:ubiquinone/menaquinone biosynthesis C-methylase UbiE